MDKIQTNAMLVKVRCTKWNNSITDREITDQVTFDKSAADGYLRVTKRLAKQAVVKELNKIIGQVGNTVLRLWTVPWDDGVHLITVDNLDRFEAALRKKADRLEELKSELQDTWPAVIEADRIRLGAAFDENDYPSVTEIVNRYSISYKLMPLPSGDDIRVNLPQQRVNAIRQQVERDVAAKVEAGAKVVSERVAEVLTTFIEGMERHGTKADGAKRASKFADSTVEAIERLAEALPGLNLTGDPALTAVSNDLFLKLRDLDPQVLREDEGKRQQAADTAKEIVSKLSGFFD
tara:strand:+ start:19012 stop:19887 length:876 start_codon:yes stop_codon:yes gene_type:complete